MLYGTSKKKINKPFLVSFSNAQLSRNISTVPNFSSYNKFFFIYYTMLVIYNIFIKLFHQFYDKIFFFSIFAIVYFFLTLFRQCVSHDMIIFLQVFFSSTFTCYNTLLTTVVYLNSNILYDFLTGCIKAELRIYHYFHNISYNISFHIHKMKFFFVFLINYSYFINISGLF